MSQNLKKLKEINKEIEELCKKKQDIKEQISFKVGEKQSLELEVRQEFEEYLQELTDIYDLSMPEQNEY